MFEVMTEILNPYKNVMFQVEQKAATDPNFRPIVPSKFADDLMYYEYIPLMKSCWQHDSANRPTALELLKKFESLKEAAIANEKASKKRNS